MAQQQKQNVQAEEWAEWVPWQEGMEPGTMVEYTEVTVHIRRFEDGSLHLFQRDEGAGRQVMATCAGNKADFKRAWYALVDQVCEDTGSDLCSDGWLSDDEFEAHKPLWDFAQDAMTLGYEEAQKKAFVTGREEVKASLMQALKECDDETHPLQMVMHHHYTRVRAICERLNTIHRGFFIATT